MDHAQPVGLERILMRHALHDVQVVTTAQGQGKKAMRRQLAIRRDIENTVQQRLQRSQQHAEIGRRQGRVQTGIHAGRRIERDAARHLDKVVRRRQQLVDDQQRRLFLTDMPDRNGGSRIDAKVGAEKGGRIGLGHGANMPEPAAKSTRFKTDKARFIQYAVFFV